MTFSTFLYQRELSSGRRIRRIWRLLRKSLIKVGYNPPCNIEIHGRTLTMPLSHDLPQHLKENPFYDSLPARLSDYIRSKYGFLKCVDVGANIGDTVTAFRRHEDDLFLAIEPNPVFRKFLQVNFGQSAQVKILPVLCSSSHRETKYQIQQHLGTASIIRSEHGTEIETETLDRLIAANPDFSDLNVLKIDTDGHDLEVIDGGKATIERLLPAILFEFHAFGKNEAVKNCTQTFDYLKSAGYSSVILYDNHGYLIGRQSLDGQEDIQDRLFHHLWNKQYYLDFLLMNEADSKQFLESERRYFLNKLAGVSSSITEAQGAILPD